MGRLAHKDKWHCSGSLKQSVHHSLSPCQCERGLTLGQGVESQLDPGEGPAADLPADLVEAHPATDDELLDGALVLAHGGGQLLQGAETQLLAGLLVLGADVRAVGQAVDAVVDPGARHLVLAPRHFLQRAGNKTQVTLETQSCFSSSFYPLIAKQRFTLKCETFHLEMTKNVMMSSSLRCWLSADFFVSK